MFDFGMCSGIAASLHFAAGLDPKRPAHDLLATTLLINAGRILGYVIAGVIVGGVGSGVFGAFDHATGNAVLRWAAAAALGWIGLSMLEIVPLPAPLYRVASHPAPWSVPPCSRRCSPVPGSAGPS
jgi:sulfite exporter TauE/SafE